MNSKKFKNIIILLIKKEMEKEKVQSPEREMCSLCHIFWGSKEAKGMCSKCFKEHLLTSEISSRAKRQTVEQDKHEYLPAPVMKNPGQMEENIIDEGDILPQQVIISYLMYIYIYI